MAVKEIDGLLQVKDEKGDVNTIYPVTKAENVEGLYGEDGKIPADQLPEMDYLPLAGGTVTGDIIFRDTREGIGFANSVSPFNKHSPVQFIRDYVGNVMLLLATDPSLTVPSLRIGNFSGVTFSPETPVKGIADPTEDTGAANKRYVDVAVEEGMKDFVKYEVDVSSTPIWETYDYISISDVKPIAYVASDGKKNVVSIAVNGSGHDIHYSADCGETFLKKSDPWFATSKRTSGVAYVCGYFVVINGSTESNPEFLISKDGKTWEKKHLNWSLSDDDRLNANKRIIGEENWGFVYPYDEYSYYRTAVLITKSGNDLNFTEVPFSRNAGASYNDGYYVTWGMDSRYLKYSTGKPDSSLTSIELPTSLTSNDKIIHCVYCNGFIVLFYRGYFSGEKTTISLYSISEKKWYEKIYQSSDDTSCPDMAAVSDSKVLILRESDTNLIVDTETKVVTILQADCNADTTIANLYPDDSDIRSISMFGSRQGVYRSESLAEKKYKLTNLKNDYIGDGVKIETGSYIGTGTYGEGDKNIITLSFFPKLFIISGQGSSFFSSGAAYVPVSVTGYDSGGMNVNMSGNTVSWYASKEYYQLNEKDKKYNYVAFG